MEEKEMPLNVRRFYSSVLLVLIFTFIAFGQTQTPRPVIGSTALPSPSPAPTSGATSGDVMRDRINRSKAFIAVRNYSAAIYELENIRRESADPAVQSVVNVLLMNSYLEQGDYKRAQDFLGDAYNKQKSGNNSAIASYNAIAGQVVKGARNRAERFAVLGLKPDDRTLPLEALNDLEKMRETLEVVITQSKEVSANKQRAPQALALIEEAGNARGMLARDEYDARRWRDDVADTREAMAGDRSIVLNAVAMNETPSADPSVITPQISMATPNPNAPSSVSNLSIDPVPSDTNSSKPKTPPQSDSSRRSEVNGVTVEKKNAEKTAKNDKPKQENKETVAQQTQPSASTLEDQGPLNIGQLAGFATKRQTPVYPAAAKTMRTTGIVRVDVVVDENGEVAEVQKMSGPITLQSAAREAIRRWKFKPFTRDGQPVKANGYIDFNFNL